MPCNVKICGITNIEDAMDAVAAGADALGFVFCPASPRHVTLAKAREIIALLPPLLAKVAVLVNPTPELVMEAIRMAGFNTIQFHGEESPEWIQALALHSISSADHTPLVPPHDAAGRLRVHGIKAVRIRNQDSVASLAPYRTDAWLLDAYVAGNRGGTGASFNWDLAIAAGEFHRPIVLAGGLTPENVAQAVQRVRPHAVDVSSGVEAAPGKKDSDKVRAFIAAAKSV
jgi:phosphoribosylanthranilate isomerase